MSDSYIEVTVTEGMFSNERTASFSQGEKTVSLIVDHRDIVNNNRLRVRVIHQANDYVVVALPRDPFSGSSRLKMPTSQLLAH